jgi:hypothetical protein
MKLVLVKTVLPEVVMEVAAAEVAADATEAHDAPIPDDCVSRSHFV